MKITEFIKENIVILDGGMGTLLQERGLASGERPEVWNITHPDAVTEIHRAYLDAGCNIVSTNTFGANLLKFSHDELEGVISAAVENARCAVNNSNGEKQKWVALDIGPTGKLLKPLGDLDFEDAVAIFAETVKLGVKCGVDLIFIETMSDSYETKAAVLAAKENSTLPVFVSNAYGMDGKLMTGADPMAMIAMLEGMGADAIGVNCSLGPDALKTVVDEYLKYSSLPIIVKPNAGLPRIENGNTVYDLSVNDFKNAVISMARSGVRAIGGCCGTTPEYIKALADGSKDIEAKPIENKNVTLVSSYTHSVVIGNTPVLIGERINPTGKPRFREAVKSGDMGYIIKEAIGQEEHGAHVLDVNLGIAGIDESRALTDAVMSIQQVCTLPLQIDSSNPVAMEAALRRYNGKAMINSVNGKQESLDAILPIAKKYGGVLVALTLDENGIPAKAEDRLEIARKILREAEKAGIEKKNIIFDPLAMAVSADKDAANQTLRALKLINEELGAHTSLGISNVSFGLPAREHLNATFFTMALNNGLSAAIINPYSDEMIQSYYTHLALSGLDDNFEKYISFADGLTKETAKTTESDVADLKKAIIKGLKDVAAELTKEALKVKEPLDIVNRDIIPALDEVGEGYEQKRIYLPSLLMSAEAAGAAFECIKSGMPEASHATKCSIILATVKGDVHDIGKNIVKLILENYGFDVTDLGKDVAPQKIVDEALSKKAKIVGLSALMTTTLPAMAETVRLLKAKLPECSVMVGGAVLTEEYAAEIGADFYGKDALDAVKFAEKINNV